MLQVILSAEMQHSSPFLGLSLSPSGLLKISFPSFTEVELKIIS